MCREKSTECDVPELCTGSDDQVGSCFIWFIPMYFSLIAYINHALNCSWNQPVLSDDGKAS